MPTSKISWVQHAENVVRTATLSTLATTGTVTALSKFETQHAAAALNATSHIIWGDRAMDVKTADAKHTLVGGALNASAMGFWALASELLPRATSLWTALLKGTLVSGAAYVVDYVVVPKRLTPGFERHLSRKGLFITYGAFAAALAAGECLAMRRR